MCDLWKQNVLSWPDPSAKHLKESAEIFDSC